MASAPALSRMRTLSNATPGNARGIDPVAMITCLPTIVAAPGPSIAIRHRSPSLPVNAPRPWKKAILFFLNR